MSNVQGPESNADPAVPVECFAIKDWDKHFENSESRKIKSLTWLPVKNKHDGKGYRRVVAHPKSIQVFCAWHLMIQVASKMPVRGVLRDDDGPLTASDLSYKTGFPEHIFNLAFVVLKQKEIGWLQTVSPDFVPASPETSAPAGIEGNGTEQNRREGTTTLNKQQKEKGSGEKPNPPHAPEIPDEDEAVVMCMTAGIDEKFVRYVYRQWKMQAGRNGNGVSVVWLDYAVGRWANEQVEWRNGTHRGNKKSAGLERTRLPEDIKVPRL